MAEVTRLRSLADLRILLPPKDKKPHTADKSSVAEPDGVPTHKSIEEPVHEPVNEPAQRPVEIEKEEAEPIHESASEPKLLSCAWLHASLVKAGLIRSGDFSQKSKAGELTLKYWASKISGSNDWIRELTLRHQDGQLTMRYVFHACRSPNGEDARKDRLQEPTIVRVAWPGELVLLLGPRKLSYETSHNGLPMRLEWLRAVTKDDPNHSLRLLDQADLTRIEIDEPTGCIAYRGAPKDPLSLLCGKASSQYPESLPTGTKSISGHPIEWQISYDQWVDKMLRRAGVEEIINQWALAITARNAGKRH